MNATRVLLAGVVLACASTTPSVRGAPFAEDAADDEPRPAVPAQLESLASQLGIGRFVDLWKEILEDEDGGTDPPAEVPLTIFAPSDTWLAKGFPVARGNADAAALSEFIRHHVVVQGSTNDAQLPEEDLQTLAGARVRVRRSPVGVFVNGVRLSSSDVRLPGSSSTVIHVIEGLLCCNESEALTAARGQTLIDLLPAVHASTFRSLLYQTDCVTSLDPPGVYTLFVPTDDSFARLDPTLLNALKSDPTQLKNVLLYHVVPGRLSLADLRHGQPITTKMGNVLLPNIPPTSDNQTFPAVVSGARVLRPDIFSKNGVVHVIDRVLVGVPHGHLLHTLANRTDFSGFLNRLVAANLTRLLVGKQPLTIFAPTNDALDRMRQEGTELTPMDLLDHVVVGPIFTANLQPDEPLICLSGRQLNVEQDQGGTLRVGGSPFVGDEILATNGVIHPIGQPVRPSTEMTDRSTDQPAGIHGLPPFGRSTPRPYTGPHGLGIGKPGHSSILDVIQLVLQRVIPLRTMVTSLLVTRIGQDLRTRGPFTVFVPNDAAFKQHHPPLFVMLIKNNTYVRELLYNHLVPGTYTCADLATRNSLTTMRGQVLQLNSPDDGHGCPRINGARIIQPDVVASNGIVHVVGALVWSGRMVSPVDVQLESTGILKRLEDMGAFIMASLLRKSGLVPMLDEQGPFTVMAPVDTAWERLPASVQQHLDDNLPALRELLLYHVISRELLLQDLRDTQVLNSTSGLAIPVRIYQRPSGEQVITISGSPIVERSFHYRGGILILCTKVVFPVPQGDILTTLAGWNDNSVHRTLSALQLVPELLSPVRTFTVFCPEDSAYDMLSMPFNDLIEMQAHLASDLLRGHVVEGTYFLAGLNNGTKLKTIGEHELHVERATSGVTINGVPIVMGDIICTNGVIHIIPSILIISTTIPFATKKDLDTVTYTPFLTSEFTPDYRSITSTVTIKPREDTPVGKPSYPTEDYSQETSAEIGIVTEITTEPVSSGEFPMPDEKEITYKYDEQYSKDLSSTQAPGEKYSETPLSDVTTVTVEPTEANETVLSHTYKTQKTTHVDQKLISTESMAEITTSNTLFTSERDSTTDLYPKLSTVLPVTKAEEELSTKYDNITTINYVTSEIVMGKTPQSEAKMLETTHSPVDDVTSEISEQMLEANGTESPELIQTKVFTESLPYTTESSTLTTAEPGHVINVTEEVDVKATTIEDLVKDTTDGLDFVLIGNETGTTTPVPEESSPTTVSYGVTAEVEETTVYTNVTRLPDIRKPKEFTGEPPYTTTESSSVTSIRLNVTVEEELQATTVESLATSITEELDVVLIGNETVTTPAPEKGSATTLRDGVTAEVEETTVYTNVTELPDIRKPKEFTGEPPYTTTESSNVTSIGLNVTDEEEVQATTVESLATSTTEGLDAVFSGNETVTTPAPEESSSTTVRDGVTAELEETTVYTNVTELLDIREPKEFTGEPPYTTTDSSNVTGVGINATEEEELQATTVKSLATSTTEGLDVVLFGNETITKPAPEESSATTVRDGVTAEVQETTVYTNVTELPDIRKPKEFTGEPPYTTTESGNVTGTGLNVTDEEELQHTTIEGLGVVLIGNESVTTPAADESSPTTVRDIVTAEIEETTVYTNVTELPDIRKPKEFTGEPPYTTESINVTSIGLNVTDEEELQATTVEGLDVVLIGNETVTTPTAEESSPTTVRDGVVTAEVEETTVYTSVTELPDIREPKEFTGEPPYTTIESSNVTGVGLNVTDEEELQATTVESLATSTTEGLDVVLIRNETVTTPVPEESSATTVKDGVTAEIEETTVHTNVTEFPDIRKPKEFTGEPPYTTTEISNVTGVALNVTDEEELQATTVESLATSTTEELDIILIGNETVTTPAPEESSAATVRDGVTDEVEETTIYTNVTELPDIRKPKEFTGEPAYTTTESSNVTGTGLNVTDEEELQHTTVEGLDVVLIGNETVTTPTAEESSPTTVRDGVTAELEETTVYTNVTELLDIREPKEFTGEPPYTTTDSSNVTGVGINATEEEELQATTVKSLATSTTEGLDVVLFGNETITKPAPEESSATTVRDGVTTEIDETTVHKNVTELPDIRKPKEFTGEPPYTTTESSNITGTGLNVTDEQELQHTTVEGLDVVLIGNETVTTPTAEESSPTTVSDGVTAEVEETTVYTNVTDFPDIRKPKEFTGEPPYTTTESSNVTDIDLNVTNEEELQASTVESLVTRTTEELDVVLIGNETVTTPAPEESWATTIRDRVTAEVEETTVYTNVTELPDIRKPKEFTGESPYTTTEFSNVTGVGLNVTDKEELPATTIESFATSTTEELDIVLIGNDTVTTSAPEESLATTVSDGVSAEVEETTVYTNVTELPDIRKPKEFTGEPPYTTTEFSNVTGVGLTVTDEEELPATTVESLATSTTEGLDVVLIGNETVITPAPEESSAATVTDGVTAEVEETTVYTNVTELPDIRKPKEFTGESPYTTTEFSNVTGVGLNVTDEEELPVTTVESLATSTTEGLDVVLIGNETVITPAPEESSAATVTDGVRAEVEETTVYTNVTELPDIRKPKEYTGEPPYATTETSNVTGTGLNVTDEEKLQHTTVEGLDVVLIGNETVTTSAAEESSPTTVSYGATAEVEETTVYTYVTELPEVRKPKEFTGEPPYTTTESSNVTDIDLNVTNEALQATTLESLATSTTDGLDVVLIGNETITTPAPQESLATTVKDGVTAEVEETTVYTNVTELPDIIEPKEFTGESPFTTTESSNVTGVGLNVTDEEELQATTVGSLATSTTEGLDVVLIGNKTITTPAPEESLATTVRDGVTAEVEETTVYTNVTELPDIRKPKEFTGEPPYTITDSDNVTGVGLNVTYEEELPVTTVESLATSTTEGLDVVLIGNETVITPAPEESSATTVTDGVTADVEETTVYTNVTELPDIRKPKEFTGEPPYTTTESSNVTDIILNVTNEEELQATTVESFATSTTEGPDVVLIDNETVTTPAAGESSPTTVSYGVTTEVEETTVYTNVTELPEIRKPKEFTEEPPYTTKFSNVTGTGQSFTDEEEFQHTTVEELDVVLIGNETLTTPAPEESSATTVRDGVTAEEEETTVYTNVTELPDIRKPKEFTGEPPYTTTESSNVTDIILNVTNEEELQATTVESFATSTTEGPDVVLIGNETLTTPAPEESSATTVRDGVTAEEEETTVYTNVTELPDIRKPKEFTGEPPYSTTESSNVTGTGLNVTDEEELQATTVKSLATSTTEGLDVVLIGNETVTTPVPEESLATTLRDGVTAEVEETTVYTNVTELPDIRKPKEFTGEPPYTTTESSNITGTGLNVTDEEELQHTTVEGLDVVLIGNGTVTTPVPEESLATTLRDGVTAEVEETTVYTNVTELPDIRKPKEFTGEPPYTTTEFSNVTGTGLNVTDEEELQHTTVEGLDVILIGNETVTTPVPEESLATTLRDGVTAEVEETTVYTNVTELPDIRKPKEFTGEPPYTTTESSNVTGTGLNVTDEEEFQATTVKSLATSTTEGLDVVLIGNETVTTPVPEESLATTLRDGVTAEVEETTVYTNVTELPDIRKPKEFTGEPPYTTTESSNITGTGLNVTDEEELQHTTVEGLDVVLIGNGTVTTPVPEESLATTLRDGVTAEVEETTVYTNVTELPDIRKPKEFTGEPPYTTTESSNVTGTGLNVTDEEELQATTVESLATSTTEGLDVVLIGNETVTTPVPEESLATTLRDGVTAEVEETTVYTNVTELPDIRKPKEFTGEPPYTTTESSNITGTGLNVTDEEELQHTTVEGLDVVLIGNGTVTTPVPEESLATTLRDGVTAEVEETTVYTNVTELPDIRKPKEFTGEPPYTTTEFSNVTGTGLNVTDEEELQHTTVEGLDVILIGNETVTTPVPEESLATTLRDGVTAEVEETTVYTNVTELPDIRKPKEFTGEPPYTTTESSNVTGTGLNVTDEEEFQATTVKSLATSTTEGLDVVLIGNETVTTPVPEESLATTLRDGVTAEVEETTVYTNVTELPDIRKPKEFTGEPPYTTTESSNITGTGLNVTDEEELQHTTVEGLDVVLIGNGTVTTPVPEESLATTLRDGVTAEVEETTVYTNVTELPDIRKPKEFTGEPPYTTTESSNVTGTGLNVTDEEEFQATTVKSLATSTTEGLHVVLIGNETVTTPVPEESLATTLRDGVTAEVEETTVYTNVTELPDIRKPKEFTAEPPYTTTDSSNVTGTGLNVTDEEELQATTVESLATSTTEGPDVVLIGNETVTTPAPEESSSTTVRDGVSAEIEETTVYTNVTELPDIRKPKDFTGEPPYTTAESSNVTGTGLNVTDEEELQATTVESLATSTTEGPDVVLISNETVTTPAPEESSSTTVRDGVSAEIEETTVYTNVTELPDIRKPKDFTGEPPYTTTESSNITGTGLNVTDEEELQHTTVESLATSTTEGLEVVLIDNGTVTTPAPEESLATTVRDGLKAEVEETTVYTNVTESPDIRKPKEFTREPPYTTAESSNVTGTGLNVTDEEELQATTVESLATSTTEGSDVVLIGNETVTTHAPEESSSTTVRDGVSAEIEETTVYKNVTELPDIRKPKEFTGEPPYTSTESSNITGTGLNLTDEEELQHTTVESLATSTTEGLDVVLISNETVTTPAPEESLATTVRDGLTAKVEETTIYTSVTELPEIIEPKEFTGEPPYTTTESGNVTGTGLNVTDEEELQHTTIEGLGVVLIGNESVTTPAADEISATTVTDGVTAEVEETTVYTNVTELPDIRKPKEFTGEPPYTTTESGNVTGTGLNVTDEEELQHTTIEGLGVVLIGNESVTTPAADESSPTTVRDIVTAEIEETTVYTNVTELPDIRKPKEFTGEPPYTTESINVTSIGLNVTDEEELQATTVEKLATSTTEGFDSVLIGNETVTTHVPEESTATTVRQGITDEGVETTLYTNITKLPKEFTEDLPHTPIEASTVSSTVTSTDELHLEGTTFETFVTGTAEELDVVLSGNETVTTPVPEDSIWTTPRESIQIEFELTDFPITKEDIDRSTVGTDSVYVNFTTSVTKIAITEGKVETMDVPETLHTTVTDKDLKTPITDSGFESSTSSGLAHTDLSDSNLTTETDFPEITSVVYSEIFVDNATVVPDGLIFNDTSTVRSHPDPKLTSIVYPYTIIPHANQSESTLSMAISSTPATKVDKGKSPAQAYPSDSSEIDLESTVPVIVTEEQSTFTYYPEQTTFKVSKDTDDVFSPSVVTSTSPALTGVTLVTLDLDAEPTWEPKDFWPTNRTEFTTEKFASGDDAITFPDIGDDLSTAVTTSSPGLLSTTSPETIPEMMDTLPLTTLKDMIERAGLDKNITDGGPITIFAPTDSAFGSLGNQTLVSLLEQTDSLQEVLLYHCSPIRISVKDLVGLVSAPTFSGHPIFINTYQNRGVTTVQVNGVPVQPVEHGAGNGVIFLIGQVLRPPQGDIVHIIDTQLHLSTLLAHLMQNELYRLLQGRGPYTVFAPNEASWGKLPLQLAISFTQKPELLREFLLGHVVKGAIFTSGLLDGNQLRTMNGAILNVRWHNGVTYVNNARLVQPDISAENGVVHVVDSVISPQSREKAVHRPPAITGPVSSYPNFPPGWPFHIPPPPTVVVAPIVQALADANLTEFPKLIADAGLPELLQTLKSVTILAPSDEALRSLPKLPLSTVRQLVLHHVIPNLLFKSNFTNGSWPTLRGGSVNILVPPNNQPIHIDSGIIVRPDLPLPSGVIHIVNKVLEPGHEFVDVWEAIEERLPELSQVVGDTKLHSHLQGKKYLTLFAPSSGYWMRLPQEIRDFLIFNRTAATEVLLCHVCSGNVSSIHFRPGMQIETLCGKIITIDHLSNTSWTANGSPLLKTDIPARDGTIHIVDRTLFIDTVVPDFSTFPGGREMPIGRPISAPRPGPSQKSSGGSAPYPTESDEMDSSQDVMSLLDSQHHASPVIPAVTSTPWDLDGLESGSGSGPRPLLTLTTGRFYRLLDEMKLSSNLATGGPYTIFAPSDAALEDVPDWHKIVQDSQRLRSILLYHVVPGLVSLTDLFHGTELPTLAGKPIRLSASSKSVLVNEATVLGKQDREDDNRSYIIDRVLIPAPNDPVGKLVQDHFDLEALNHLLRGHDVHVLNGNTPITAFLPIDAAFYESDPSLLSQLRQNQSALQEFILGHIVPGTYYSGSLEDGQVLRSMSGQPLYISKTDGFKVNGATIVSPDVTTSNGVIHFTDKILIGTDTSALIMTPPPPPLVNYDVDLLTLASLLNLTVFVDLVELAGIQHEISSRSPHTLFVPTDDAFQTLPPSLFQELQSDKEKLKRLLRYHVVNGHLPITSINNEMIRPSLVRGKDLRFNVYNTRFGKQWTASGSPVTRADNEARNGRIHIVKQVLYVPWGNLLQTLDRSSILQSITDSVKTTGLNRMLRGTSPLTFFAPSDEAFRELPEAVQERLGKEPELLRSLLLRHVVRGTYYSTGLADQAKLTPLAGPPLDIRALADCILVNNSTIIYPDVTASNGVVHVINRIL